MADWNQYSILEIRCRRFSAPQPNGWINLARVVFASCDVQFLSAHLPRDWDTAKAKEQIQIQCWPHHGDLSLQEIFPRTRFHGREADTGHTAICPAHPSQSRRWTESESKTLSRIPLQNPVLKHGAAVWNCGPSLLWICSEKICWNFQNQYDFEFFQMPIIRPLMWGSLSGHRQKSGKYG